jgi:hypothetical protein
MSSQSSAEWQRERERRILLAIEPLDFESRLLRRVAHLHECTLELVLVSCRHGHVPGESDRGVAVGELLLSPRSGLDQLAPPGGGEKAMAPPELVVSSVGCPCGLRLTERA